MTRRVVADLNPEDLEPGVHELWLHLVDDALGVPVRLPVLAARGSRPGRVVGITGAVHGDEVNGIAVIRALFAKLQANRLRGTVLAIPVVNVPAFHQHQRRTPHGFDLNHHFPGAPDGNDIQVYASRVLSRFVRHVEGLIDLHTASRGRANCLYVRADMESEETARMAYLQRPQIILHNPASDGTLRGAASELSVPAITVEVGNPSRFHREYIRRSVVGVRAVLADWDMIGKRQVDLGPEPVICSDSTWLYTDRGGLLEVLPKVTDHVQEGEIIARLVDPFGNLVAEYQAPYSGVVIGCAVDPVAATGARILHLGRPVEDPGAYVRRMHA
jgi:predicted deacylase